MKPRIISGPLAEPLTLVEAKGHLRVTVSEDDDLITSLIQAARESAELYCERSFAQRTYRLTLDGFPSESRCPILLRYPPLVRVDHVKYLDTDGTQLTWDSDEYSVDIDSEPGRILPVPDKVYPTDIDHNRMASVEVQYVAGYEGSNDSPTDYAANIPRAVKQAMLLMIGHWYENREDVVVGGNPLALPEGSRSLLWQYKVFR